MAAAGLRSIGPKSVSPLLVSNNETITPSAQNSAPTFPWGTGAAPVTSSGSVVVLQRAHAIAFLAFAGTPTTAAGASVTGLFSATIVGPNGSDVLGVYSAFITATPLPSASFTISPTSTPGPKFGAAPDTGKWSGYVTATNTSANYNTTGNDIPSGDLAGPYIRGLQITTAAYALNIPVGSTINWTWSSSDATLSSKLLTVFYSQVGLAAPIIATPHYAPWRVRVNSTVPVDHYDAFWRTEAFGTVDDWYQGTATGTGAQMIEGPAVATPGDKVIYTRATQSDGGEAWFASTFTQNRLTRAGATMDAAECLRSTYQISTNLADTRHGAGVYAGPGTYATAIPNQLPSAIGQLRNGAHWVLRGRVSYRTTPPSIGLESFDGWEVGVATSMNPRRWNEPQGVFVKVWDDPLYEYADLIECQYSGQGRGALSVALYYKPANYDVGEGAVTELHFKRAPSLLGPWPSDDDVRTANDATAGIIASTVELAVAISFGPYKILETRAGQIWVFGQGYYRSKDGGRTWLGHGTNPFID